MATKKRKTYRVGALVSTWTEIEIPAESLADAVEASKGLKSTDFVDTFGEEIDSSFRVVAVSESAIDV